MTPKRMLTILSGLGLLLLLPASGRSAPADSPFGINGATWSHLGANTDEFAWEQGLHRLDSLQAMGAAWDRCDFWWHRIEPEKGRFVWRDYDRIVDEYQRRGLHLLPILAYDAAWSNDQSPETDANREEYGRFVFETVKHFKGRIRAYEVWNEPNISIFWRTNPGPEMYTRLLAVAHREAKRADPGVLVVGGAVAGMDFDFIEGLLKTGAAEHMDAISVHPYQGNLGSLGPEEGNLTRDLRRLKTLLARSGHKDMPIWITEMGHRTVPDPSVPKGGFQPTGRVTEQQQANYLVRSYALALSQDVEKVFWFNLQDWPTETWGTIAEDFRRKPSWYAYRTMASTLAGLPAAAYYEAPGVRSVAFSKVNASGPWATGDPYAVVTWATSPGASQGWKASPGTSLLRPSYRNTAAERHRLMMVGDERASVALSGAPAYLTGRGGLLPRGSDVEVQVSPATVAPGDRLTLSVRYASPEARTALAKKPRAVVLYGRDSSNSLKAYLEPAGKDAYRVRGTLPPGQYNVGYVWLSELPRKDVTPARFEATTRLTVRPALSIFVTPNPAQGRNLRLNVTNNSAGPATVTATVDMVGSRTDTISNIVLAPRQAMTLPINNTLSADRPLTTPLPVTATARSRNGSTSWAGNVYFWAAGKSWGPPLVLDSAQQWQTQDGTWTGPEDLSSTIRARYDENNLYLNAEVIDDVFSQSHTLGEVWRGDAFQIAVDPGWTRRPDASSATEFGLALTPDGPQVFRWTGERGLLPGASLKVSRAGNRSVYEAMIPWKSLGVANVRPGRAVGFALILNDNDGENRQGWLMYGDGIATEKRADRYATLTLLPAR